MTRVVYCSRLQGSTIEMFLRRCIRLLMNFFSDFGILLLSVSYVKTSQTLIAFKSLSLLYENLRIILGDWACRVRYKLGCARLFGLNLRQYSLLIDCQLLVCQDNSVVLMCVNWFLYPFFIIFTTKLNFVLGQNYHAILVFVYFDHPSMLNSIV